MASEERIYHVIENDSAQEEKEGVYHVLSETEYGCKVTGQKNDAGYRKDEERVYHVISEVEAPRSKVSSRKVEMEEEGVYHVLETPDHAHACS